MCGCDALFFEQNRLVGSGDGLRGLGVEGGVIEGGREGGREEGGVEG